MLRSFDLKWDGDDNLREAYQQGTLWVQATYNGDGLRVHKQDIFTSTHDYTWGLGGVLYDAANNTTTTPGVSQNVNGVDQFFETDWLGSTRYLTDSTGNNAPSLFRYDAFGGRTVTTSGNWSPTESLFAGEWGYQTEWSNYNEPGLGLQYLQERYYDPGVGRFISQDPIGLPGGLNLYGYAGNDPVNRLDPSGLQAEEEPFRTPEEAKEDQDEFEALQDAIKRENERRFQQLLQRHGLTPAQWNACVAEISKKLLGDPFNPGGKALPEFIAPRGFTSPGQFQSFANRFRAAAGEPLAPIGVRGSSTTGASFRTGEPFGENSDIDFFIVSNRLYRIGMARGAKPRNGALPVGATNMFRPLRETQRALSAELGRDVSIRIYSSSGYRNILDLRDVFAR